MSDKTYVLNSRIVADDFDDETVLINVERGLYFSMQGSARDIWQAFASPRAHREALAVLTDGLDADQHRLVEAVIARMIETGLIIEAETEPEAVPATVLNSIAAPGFALPVLGVFSDLAELIAIDPVHEVDEAAGWPVRPANFPEPA